ncbi:MAG: DUF4198 domain-containing protein [Proteobacteria bacterium]|nr:DUF4198 domain-containing protein [Pseudomonadota bacterium]
MDRSVLLSVFICLAIFAGAGSVLAHDMWLQESKEGFDIALGHKGQTDPYKPERVKEVVGYTKNGWPVQLDIERKKDGCGVMPDEGFYAICASLDNRYWLKTTDGWKNHRQRKGLEILKEGHSYKLTKHVVKWCDFLAKPLGQRFEIVPLHDHTRLKEGDRLPVKIFFEGKPASGARLAKTSSMGHTHDLESVQGEGPFMVYIGAPGLQLVNAKFELPVQGRQVVWFAASLTFRTTK